MAIETKNKKVIVVYGMARGGTNILWNILSSHPDVCGTNLETGELLTRRRHGIRGRILHTYYSHSIVRGAPLFEPTAKKVDDIFYRNKLETLEHEFDKYKSENEVYSPEEVTKSALCIKSVNREHELNPLFEEIYDDCRFIGLIRDGYAICESWTRRGSDVKKIAKLYRKFGEQLSQDQESFKKHRIVKFEDILSDPFKIASELYSFAGLDPVDLPAIRLKSKSVMTSDGQHNPAFGQRNKKYWFTPETIDKIIKPGIAKVQTSLLSAETKASFEEEAMPILKRFGYVGEK